MKKIVIIFASLLIVAMSNAQKTPTIEPLFKLGIYTSRTEGIMDTHSGNPIKRPLPTSSGMSYDQWPELVHTLNPKIDFYTTVGFRVNFRGFRIESENKIRCATDNFISNKPYSAEFYLRGYYEFKSGFKAGFEHLCFHGIRSENLGQVYNLRGGHNEFYISYNL